MLCNINLLICTTYSNPLIQVLSELFGYMPVQHTFCTHKLSQSCENSRRNLHDHRVWSQPIVITEWKRKIMHNKHIGENMPSSNRQNDKTNQQPNWLVNFPNTIYVKSHAMKMNWMKRACERETPSNGESERKMETKKVKQKIHATHIDYLHCLSILDKSFHVKYWNNDKRSAMEDVLMTRFTVIIAYTNHLYL